MIWRLIQWKSGCKLILIKISFWLFIYNKDPTRAGKRVNSNVFIVQLNLVYYLPRDKVVVWCMLVIYDGVDIKEDKEYF